MAISEEQQQTRDEVAHYSRNRIYNEIVRYASLHGGYAPSMRHLADACGIASTSTVFYHINTLIAEGKLEKRNNHLIVVGGKWYAPQVMKSILGQLEQMTGTDYGSSLIP